MPAFKDSVDGASTADASGTYSQGVCGEKLVVLGAETVSFLSLSANAINPTVLPFHVLFDKTLASVKLVGYHTVSY